MTLTAVVGVNWGDEGKGRVVDYLAQDHDLVVRYQGGNNAGHTVVNDLGTFRLHLIPSGIFNPAVTNVLGPGVIVDLEALVDELDQLSAAGIDTSNLRISDRATICFPFHRSLDIWEEERLGEGRAYGSTRRGIAPAYADRYLKKAVQLGELLYPAQLRDRLRQLVEWHNLYAEGIYGKADAVRFDDVWEWVSRYRPRIVDRIGDTSLLLDGAAGGGKKIIFEAQLGALRDVYYGIYPYTSSSCVLASFAPIGSGLFGRPLDRVVGVMKAFATCVGAGPFVTAMSPAEADELREVAFEYGAATGRPRRIGHFDAVASRYGAHIQGTTEIALTKLDSLSGRDRLLICTGYRIDGRTTAEFPVTPALEVAEPIYDELPGWQEDISGVREFGRLPANAREYVLTIEQLVGCPIRYISVGPDREAMIDRGAEREVRSMVPASQAI